MFHTFFLREAKLTNALDCDLDKIKMQAQQNTK